MDLIRVDTKKAYQILWEKNTSLELIPGVINTKSHGDLRRRN